MELLSVLTACLGRGYDFAGSVFSGNDTDIDNKADHAVDTAKATFE